MEEREKAQVELGSIELNDKYTRREGSIYLSGIQALVRLPMMQGRLTWPMQPTVP